MQRMTKCQKWNQLFHAHEDEFIWSYIYTFTHTHTFTVKVFFSVGEI